jgi:hypothetical protein
MVQDTAVTSGHTLVAVFERSCSERGPSHSGVQLHGFLSYLFGATSSGIEIQRVRLQGYAVVRDTIHSYDGYAVHRTRSSHRRGAVRCINIGGRQGELVPRSSKPSTCVERHPGIPLRSIRIAETARVGDSHLLLQRPASQ